MWSVSVFCAILALVAQSDATPVHKMKKLQKHFRFRRTDPVAAAAAQIQAAVESEAAAHASVMKAPEPLDSAGAPPSSPRAIVEGADPVFPKGVPTAAEDSENDLGPLSLDEAIPENEESKWVEGHKKDHHLANVSKKAEEAAQEAAAAARAAGEDASAAADAAVAATEAGADPATVAAAAAAVAAGGEIAIVDASVAQAMAENGGDVAHQLALAAENPQAAVIAAEYLNEYLAPQEGGDSESANHRDGIIETSAHSPWTILVKKKKEYVDEYPSKAIVILGPNTGAEKAKKDPVDPTAEFPVVPEVDWFAGYKQEFTVTE